MYSGAHMPNRAITVGDMERFALGAFKSAKLLWFHLPEDVVRLADVGCAHFVVRLQDSVQGGHVPSYVAYAQQLADTIHKFYGAGVRLYQVDNEPNWTWTTPDYGPWQYAWFLRNTLKTLRAFVPADVKLISPPLSFSPALWSHGPQNPTGYTLDDWLAAFNWTDSGMQPNLWQSFEYGGSNAYWQNTRQMNDPSFGMCFEQVHSMSGGKPVVVCEYGNSLRDKQPRPSDGEIEAAMLSDYPQYLQELAAHGDVEAAELFILDGTGWEGFYPSDRVLKALAKS